jgi:hypothetical protein
MVTLKSKSLVKLLVLSIPVFTIGCSTKPDEIGQLKFEPIIQTNVVHSISYPELPPLPNVMRPNIEPWRYDMPRDMKADPVVRNVSACVDVPTEKRDDAFWARCGEQPIITDPNKTNIYIGFDVANFALFERAWAATKSYVEQLEQRIELANEQRAEWVKKAQEERERAKNAGTNVPSLPNSGTAVSPTTSTPGAAPGSSTSDRLRNRLNMPINPPTTSQ